MWEGRGPRQYKMLPTGTVVCIHDQDDTIWLITSNGRRKDGGIWYNVKGMREGYLTRTWQYEMHDIESVVGTGKIVNGRCIIIPADRRGPIVNLGGSNVE